MEIIAFDSHKRYTLCSVENRKGEIIDERRIEHERGALRAHLERFTPGSPVAVETVGNWYGIVDEMEEAGMRPLLVHARKAKMMMCNANKTDRLDARGLNLLQKNGTLPIVWIPSQELRDKRDLFRTRMYLVSQRTGLKNRVHAALSRYGVVVDVSDMYGKKGREELAKEMRRLPEHTRFATEIQLGEIDALEKVIDGLEERMRNVFEETDDVRRLRTIPGIGFIFAAVIVSEAGDTGRFASSHHFASYSGVVPRVKSGGGKTSFGKLRVDVDQCLKWAFIEAANIICMNRKRYPARHVSVMYERIRAGKGHAKAGGAVARHLAEAAFSVLSKKEDYRDPALSRSFPTGA